MAREYLEARIRALDRQLADFEQYQIQTANEYAQTPAAASLRNMRLTQDFDRKVEDMKPSKRYAGSFSIPARPSST